MSTLSPGLILHRSRRKRPIRTRCRKKRQAGTSCQRLKPVASRDSCTRSTARGALRETCASARVELAQRAKRAGDGGDLGVTRAVTGERCGRLNHRVPLRCCGDLFPDEPCGRAVALRGVFHFDELPSRGRHGLVFNKAARASCKRRSAFLFSSPVRYFDATLEEGRLDRLRLDESSPGIVRHGVERTRIPEAALRCPQ